MGKNQFKENEMGETKRRAKYTLEYKMEAVRLVKGGQAVSVTAKILGIPKASLENWVRLSTKGQLKGAGDKPVNPEQMELARLRAELARVKMERDILKKATAYFARESL
jgi:transposase